MDTKGEPGTAEAVLGGTCMCYKNGLWQEAGRRVQQHGARLLLSRPHSSWVSPFLILPSQATGPRCPEAAACWRRNLVQPLSLQTRDA